MRRRTAMKHRKLRGGATLLLWLLATCLAGQDENAPLSPGRALHAEELSTNAPITAVTTAAKTVYVHCTRGGSISAALSKVAAPLVIEVRGICAEHVRIERSDVTLHGLDPASDGIRGVVTEPVPLAALEINHAARIRLENISVMESPGHGVSAEWSQLVMQNCRVERSTQAGLFVQGSSSVTATEVVASQNGRGGVEVGGSSGVDCLGCRLVDNATAAFSGGWLQLVQGEVAGGQGLVASGGWAWLLCDATDTRYPCSLDVSGDAASARRGGTVTLTRVQFKGRLSGWAGGILELSGAEQVSSDSLDRQNLMTDTATLATMKNGSLVSKLRSTKLTTFAHGTLKGETQLTGPLTCESGGDAWSDVAYSAGMVVGCEHVPTTP
jgi:hypothetical protein